MNPIFRLMLCGLALLGPASLGLRAAEPAIPLAQGRVLVLDNERTMEGDIQRLGDDYRIRRPVGEIVVPGTKVLKLCAGWKEAYAFLRTRANLGDSDERIRLARWCQLHELKNEALAEASAAVELRPYNEEARRLQSLLKRAVMARKPAPSAAPAAATSAASGPPSVDLCSEATSAFVTRIQPILMNACASCHVNNRGGTFSLIRCYQGGAPNQRATRNNLAAVVGAIDKKRPELSPLLIKAVSVHGKTGPAPLKGRQSPAYRNLQQWVETTLATNPQLVEGPIPTAATAPTSEPKASPPSVEAKPPMQNDDIGTYRPAASASAENETGVPVVAMSGFTARTSVAGSPKKASNPSPAQVSSAAPVIRPTPRPEGPPPAEPVDEFDPVIFNQSEPRK